MKKIVIATMRKIPACDGCKKQFEEVKKCIIRIYNFQVWNLKCPREEK